MRSRTVFSVLMMNSTPSSSGSRSLSVTMQAICALHTRGQKIEAPAPKRREGRRTVLRESDPGESPLPLGGLSAASTGSGRSFRSLRERFHESETAASGFGSRSARVVCTAFEVQEGKDADRSRQCWSGQPSWYKSVLMSGSGQKIKAGATERGACESKREKSHHASRGIRSTAQHRR